MSSFWLRVGLTAFVALSTGGASHGAEPAEPKPVLVDEQVRVLNGLRLAAESQAVREKLPQRSLLLAIEGFETTRQHDRSVPAPVWKSLFDAIGSIGGSPLATDDEERVTFSPDGRWLVASGRFSGVSRLWDLRTDVPSAAAIRLNSCSDRPLFDPTNRWLAMGSDVYDVTTDDPIGWRVVRLGVAGDPCLAFDPQGRWLAAGSADGTASVWDLNAADRPGPPTVLKGHSESVNVVAFSPEGRWLATASRDGDIRLWDRRDGLGGSAAIVLHREDLGVDDVAFSPDGRWLASGNFKAAVFWDLWAKTPTATADVLQEAHVGNYSIDISGDGKWLATGNDEGVARLWKLSHKGREQVPRELRRPEADRVKVVFSPDSRWLATLGEWHPTPYLWDLHAADPARTPVLLFGHETKVHDIAFGPNGRWAATVSRDGTVRLWDLGAGNPASPLFVVEKGQTHLSGDGRWLAIENERRGGQLVRIWDLRAVSRWRTGPVRDVPGRLIGLDSEGRWLATWAGGHNYHFCHLRLEDLTIPDRVLEVPMPVSERAHRVGVAAFDPTDQRLAVAHDDNSVRLWDLTADDPATGVPVLKGHEGPVCFIDFSRNGRLLATGSHDETAILWDLRADPAAPCALMKGHKGVVESVDVNSRGDWVLTTSTAPGRSFGSGLVRTVRLWKLSRDASHAATMVRQEPGVRMHFSLDDNWLVELPGWGRHGDIRFGDLRGGDVGERVPPAFKDDGEGVGGILFSRDGRWAAIGGAKVRLFDLTRQDPASQVVTLADQGGSPLDFSSDGRWLAVGFDDRVRLFHLHSRTLGTFPIDLKVQDVAKARFTADGRWLVLEGRHSRCSLWPVQPDELLELARSVAGRRLTPAEREQYLLHDASQ